MPWISDRSGTGGVIGRQVRPPSGVQKTPSPERTQPSSPATISPSGPPSSRNPTSSRPAALWFAAAPGEDEDEPPPQPATRAATRTTIAIAPLTRIAASYPCPPTASAGPVGGN